MNSNRYINKNEPKLEKEYKSIQYRMACYAKEFYKSDNPTKKQRNNYVSVLKSLNKQTKRLLKVCPDEMKEKVNDLMMVIQRGIIAEHWLLRKLVKFKGE